MRMVTTGSEMRELSDLWKASGMTTGLVPTMGALHRGHMELVRRAVAACDRVVASIFVNPAQFGKGEDLERYPRDIEGDCRVLEEAGVSAVFAPSTEEIYPDGFCTTVSVSGVTEGLCGAFRPGHFNGVTTVCAVLFGIVRPERAFFGMKDAQQLAAVKRMVHDLRLGVSIDCVDVVREEDGLAMSSRNAYLSPQERKQAAGIYTGLCLMRNMARGGETRCSVLKAAFSEHVGKLPLLRLQYIETVNQDTMRPVETVEGRMLAAASVFAGSTRLIDNVIIEPEV
jgi:pantoate--beta-alanine ligase